MMDNMKNLYLRASKASIMSVAQQSSSSSGVRAASATSAASAASAAATKAKAASGGGTKNLHRRSRSHSRADSGSGSNNRIGISGSGGNSHKRKGRRPENGGVTGVGVGVGAGGTGGRRRRPGEEEQRRQQEEERMNRNLQSHRSDDDSDVGSDVDDDEDEYEEEIVESSSDDDGDGEFDDHSDDGGGNSVYTTITVETTRTRENENRKPTIPAIFGGGGGKKNNTQVSVGGSDPVGDLKLAVNDITKLSIYMKNVAATRAVAGGFLALMRGDDRSWEAIAVDILRQKARWESIVIEDCRSAPEESGGRTGSCSAGHEDEAADYLDLILAHILCVDNCSYLHLSTFAWTAHTAWTMQALQFCKSVQKLQLDLIDLTSAVPMLSRGLKNNRSLKVLITSRCGLQDDHLGVLLGHLPEQLEELRIFGNKCRAKGLASLTAAIQKRTTCLRHLDLSYQHVGPGEEFDISWFAEALGRKNRTLRVLDLDNDSLDDGHLTHLIAALCKNGTLEELLLNHNNISGAGVAMLAARFGEMKGLKKISMYSNMFDSPGGTAGAGGGAKGGGIDSTKNADGPVANKNGGNHTDVSNADDSANRTVGNRPDAPTTDGGISTNGNSNHATKHSSSVSVSGGESKAKDVSNGTPAHSNFSAGGKENRLAH